MAGSDLADTLAGGEGSDELLAFGGGDRVDGDAGTDRLIGGRGEETLDGGTGRDLLRGGRDADRLTGGDDRDRFVIAVNESEGDVITDFEVAGVDRGDLLAMAGFGAGATIANAGGDLWTVSDGAGSDETFRIVGVTSLGAGDYIFV